MCPQRCNCRQSEAGGLSSRPYMTVILSCHSEDHSLPTLMTERGGRTVYSPSLSLPLESSSSCGRDSEVCLPPRRRITFSNILTACNEKQLLAFNEAELTQATGDAAGRLAGAARKQNATRLTEGYLTVPRWTRGTSSRAALSWYAAVLARRILHRRSLVFVY